MTTHNAPSYELLPDNGGTFVVHDYNRAKPFTDFLPGVAGLWGTPLWCFYANRGQAVACFGIRDKDGAIMEFQSANLHHRRNSFESFRTFIRVRGEGGWHFYEPFRTAPSGYETANRLVQTPYDLTIEEENLSLGLAVRVCYFTVPGEPFAALARVVSVRNSGATPIDCEIIDGFPNVVPFGVKHELLKAMPYITDGYLRIENLEHRVPYYTIGSVPGDESQTDFVTEGHFYFAFEENAGRPSLAEVIVDPAVLFGEYNDRILPYAYLETGDFAVPAHQNTICQTPGAFAATRWRIEAGSSRRLSSLTGFARRPDQALALPERVTAAGYLDAKAAENREEIMRIRDVFFVHGGDWKLGVYIQQCFFDNVLRGGLPISLRGGDRTFVYHVFSRKHGDLERDYNHFRLEPSFFSQGNGNFRDVNQNRRNDVWFNPDVFDSNVKWFFNLIQADGFNPLLCEGSAFSVPDRAALDTVLAAAVPEPKREKLAEMLGREFTPGSLFELIHDESVELTMAPDRFLEKVLALADKHEIAAFGHGYWSDHWMYNFDLLDSFLGLYPDRLEQTLLRDHGYYFWDTDIVVLPRDRKYVITPAGAVRHLRSIARDEDKGRMIGTRPAHRHRLRIDRGRGDIYYTNLLGKILAVVVNKLASLSPSGMGVEMDGGRPGWCDSVNGIPALFAAGMPEADKLLSVLRRLETVLPGMSVSQPLPRELHDLYTAVSAALTAYAQDNTEDRDHRYWDTTSTAKERYREAVRFGFAGEERTIEGAELLDFIGRAGSHLEHQAARAVLPGTGLPVTYVIHEAQDYQPIEEPGSANAAAAPRRNADGLVCVRVTRFRHRFFAPFLEGVVYRMAREPEVSRARALWERVRTGPLYDQDLGMYKINVGLDKEPGEQGRTGGWPKGWFENESIFVHVEFKYLLQMLRSGLYREFFDDIRRCLPPYLEPDVYARNPTENVSTIVCSAHERPSYRGRGMQPRLSGNNAELVHMALLMSFGHSPFVFEKGRLRCRLAPILPSWMFSREEAVRRFHRMDGGFEDLTIPADSYAALFLGHTLVVYGNASRKDTFGERGVSPVAYVLEGDDGARRRCEGEWLEGADALAVRERRIRRIEVVLA